MKKNKKLFTAVIVLLIALGVCISISFTRSIDKKKKGNQDIINIECNDKNCEKETKKKDKKNDNNNSSINNPKTGDNKNEIDNTNSNNSNTVNVDGNGTSQSIGENNNNQSSNTTTDNTTSNSNNPPVDENAAEEITDDEKEDDDFIVSDSYQTWGQETELKIFNVDKIVPGDSGSYDFLINNNTSKNVKYTIILNETNEYNVNMLYKLKRNGEYIAGSSFEWVRYSNLNLGEKVLNSRKNDSYTIEWKWVDSDNDTQVGRTKNARYKIDISIKALETDEFDRNASASAIFNPDTGDKILYFIELAILSAIALILLIILKRRQKD